MLMRRVIPCLDVRAGRVVKGVQFAQLRDAGDPVACAVAYAAAGADELVMLDVSATLEGRAAAVETVRQVRRELTIPLTVGGGIRSIDDARRLIEVGADRVSVNSAAVADPFMLTQLAEQFGRQSVVLAIDAARSGARRWLVRTHAGRTAVPKDAVAWAGEGEARGAGEILLTSWDRDGTGAGYDLPLIAAVVRAVSCPVIASGGAAGSEHMLKAFGAGAAAVLAATIFHDQETTVGTVKDELAAGGWEVRR